MATVARAHATGDNAELRAIRQRYEIGDTVSDQEIFFRSRVYYHGGHKAAELAAAEYERFLAADEVPYHIIRCSHRDVVYPIRWMQGS